MANYSVLKAAVQAVVKTNGNQEITGANMQSTLISIINSLGTGYQFMGVATPSTSPGTPDYNVAYIGGAGTYANFGTSVTVPVGSIGVFKYNGSWAKEQIVLFAGIDDAPTATSNNLVKSGGVAYELSNKVNIKTGKNLFNNDTITSGKYFSSIGGISNSQSYSISDYIPVTAGNNLFISSTSGIVAPSNVYLIYYDSNMVFLSSAAMGTSQFAVPANAAYIRFTIYNSFNNELQVEVGTERTSYEPYSPIEGYLPNSSSVIALNKNKVGVKVGKNLYNPATITTGKYFSTAGTISSSASYNITDFIEVSEGQYYLIGYYDGGYHYLGADTSCINLYDGDKALVSTIGGDNDVITIPSGVSYIRVSIYYKNTEIQIERGNSRTEYEPYIPIGGYLHNYPTKHEEQTELNKKVSINFGKNLFNKDTITTGKYFSSIGGISNSQSYSISDYIPVAAGSNLFISSTSGIVAPSNVYLIYYDSHLTFLSSAAMGTSQFTVPTNAAYMRFTIYNAWNDELQVEVGDTRTEYELYSPIGGYNIIIKDGAVSYRKLDSGLQARIDSGGSVLNFHRFTESATLNAGEVIKTPAVYLGKDSLLTALITGTIQLVQVGVGKTETGYTYNGYWLEIDQSDVKLYMYNNITNVLVATYQHGLTLTTKTTVIVDSNITSTQKLTTLKIFNDLGGIFTQSLPAWGTGAAFVLNGNTTGSLQCEISLMPKQITKKIWLFGDSYVSFIAANRWPYYFAELGMLDFFSNNQAGLSPENGYNSLVSLLGLGVIPSYVVWTLGMNGDTQESQSGGEYVINAYQKQYIDAVVALQQQYGFNLVLGTVPTVPTRQKTGFCNYVRSLGYRVIDFAAAVGADSSGVWNTGLLSDDGVHPTEAGAKVLASRVFADFPELSIIE